MLYLVKPVIALEYSLAQIYCLCLVLIVQKTRSKKLFHAFAKCILCVLLSSYLHIRVVFGGGTARLRVRRGQIINRPEVSVGFLGPSRVVKYRAL